MFLCERDAVWLSEGVGLGFDFLGVRKDTNEDLDCLALDLGVVGVSVGEVTEGDLKALEPSTSRASVRASVRFSENRRPCLRSRRY